MRQQKYHIQGKPNAAIEAKSKPTTKAISRPTCNGLGGLQNDPTTKIR
jgi:hypothetical protein